MLLLHVTKVMETKGLVQVRKVLLFRPERPKSDWSSRCLGKGEIYGFRESSRRTYIARPMRKPSGSSAQRIQKGMEIDKRGYRECKVIMH